MRRGLALVAFLAIACSAQTSHGGPSPTASRVGVITSPSPAAATPTLSASGLACRLPVMISVPTGQAAGEWITFPDGSFHIDVDSNIDRGNGLEGISYDRAVNRWIPADWNHISPDGRRYVATESWLVQDIVDVATGAIRKVTMPAVNLEFKESSQHP
ncbi:MAG: hypothetical protein ABI334_09840 [Candidatus Dormiibacterota bacterium]